MKLINRLMERGLSKFFSYRKLVEISSKLNYPIAPPLTAVVKVTSKCNLRCRYCNIWKYQDRFQDLSVKQVNKIFISLRNLGVRIVTITGGEPLLYLNLEEIITLVKRYYMRAHVITNGILLTNDKVIKLVEAGTDSIIFSLDTFDPELYKYLTGALFKFAEQALESLFYVKKKYQDIDVAVNYVINRYNIGEIVSFAKRVTDYGKGKILINFQPYRRSLFRAKDDLAPPKEAYPVLVKEIETLIEMKKRGFPITDSIMFLKRIPNFLIYNKMSKDFKCKAGYVGIYICENMQVRPCYQLPPIGSLHEKSLEDIWFSEKFRKQRVKMKDGNCPGCLLLCHNEESWYNWYNLVDGSFRGGKNGVN